jgi:hypothetical protein
VRLHASHVAAENAEADAGVQRRLNRYADGHVPLARSIASTRRLMMACTSAASALASSIDGRSARAPESIGE